MRTEAVVIPTNTDRAGVLAVRRVPRTAGVLVAIGAVALAGRAVVDRIDARGAAFFDVGRSIAAQLNQFAAAVSARDGDALPRFYAAAYSGSRLGLTSRASVGQKDGIVQLRFQPGGSRQDAAAAVAEWRAYLASFSTIEEARFTVERLERWRGDRDIAAALRFEIIATPIGGGRSVIDRGRLRATFSRGALPAFTRMTLVDGERQTAERAQFADVAAAAGIDFVNQYYPPFLHDSMAFGMIRHGPGGITAVDYDGDGFYDLFVPDGVQARLFRNRGDGTFEDVTTRVGLAGLDGVSVGVFADYDNDGHKDVFVSRTFRPNQLFHNRGDNTFEDLTAASGIGAECCVTVASWGDYDNDGLLDLYLGRYLDPRTKIPTTFYARNGEPNQLYHNDGGGHFTNVTVRAGVGDTGLCLGSAFGDYDNDGYADLLAVNDFGRSTLYHNNRNGTFTDVTVASGTLAYGAGMNASFADYDGDGRLDIYTTDIRSDSAWFAESPTVARYMLNSFRQGVWTTDMPLYLQIFRQSGFGFTHVFQEMASGNHLLRNRGDATFDDVSHAAGADPPGWFWGAAVADFNNDAAVDIYAATGWVYGDRHTELELEFLNNVVTRQDEYKTGAFFNPASFGRRSWHGWERNRHLRNNGDGTFTEIGHAAGSDLLLNSRGVAVADFLNRGVLDIAVAASNDRHALLANQLAAADRHWIGIELTGVRSNRDAVGARLTVRTGSKRQTREVALGDGYGSQSSLRQYVGLGPAGTIDELTIRWPRSGIVQTFSGVAADRIVEIVEGRDALVEKHYSRPAAGQ